MSLPGRKSLVPVALVVALFVAACGGTGPTVPTGVTVNGLVVDLGGQPLSGLLVYIAGQPTEVSGEDGKPGVMLVVGVNGVFGGRIAEEARRAGTSLERIIHALQVQLAAMLPAAQTRIAYLPAKPPAPVRPSRPTALRRLAEPGLLLDLERGQALIDGRDIALSRREYELLVALIGARRTPLTRAELYRRVWDQRSLSATRTHRGRHRAPPPHQAARLRPGGSHRPWHRLPFRPAARGAVQGTAQPLRGRLITTPPGPADAHPTPAPVPLGWPATPATSA